MKGLLNNEKAVNVLNTLKNYFDTRLDNRIHEIYNLGYKQGYEDGQYECIERLTEQILAERRADDR